jgi:two-component system, OmpR family, sensor histidine kinase MtrB
MSSDGERRLSLRVRSAAAFAALALILSAGLALVSYELSRHYLLSKRESGSTRQALIDAGVVAGALEDPRVRVPSLPTTMRDGVGFGALLRLDDEWYGEGASDAARVLPSSLIALADQGKVAGQRAPYHGANARFVAVPLQRPGAIYVEVFPLADLERTLQTIAAVTLIGAIMTTIAGAGLGIIASRRVLHPLRELAVVAEEIAGGQHDRRLKWSRDKDLAPLIASFNRMVDTLEQRVDREARFASDVSHEMRTPLTAIRAAIDVLDGRIQGENARPVFEVLRAQCERFDRLVLDILEISRLEGSDQQLDLEAVDPRAVVSTTLMNTGHGDIPMEVDPATPASFLLDKRRVDRMLVNLLANADLHAGGAVGVTISTAGSSLRIAVHDAGPGVPVEERELIFERFARGRLAARDTGTGLGLPLVAENCRALGGRVWIEDRPQGGATFVIEIPDASQ